MRVEGLDNLYELKKTIGSGGFAKVKLAVHSLTGEKVAIKIMGKSALGDDIHRVKEELKALKNLDHPNICKLYEVIETSTHFLLVVEYCSRGELFDCIVENKRLSENDARTFFRQIVSAMAHIHDCGFVHRDLKPENILLDRNGSIKIIDFGLCARPPGGVRTFLETSCGSPSYAAPELLRGKKYRGSDIDIWGLGVLLYVLLCGFLPFNHDDLSKLCSLIMRGVYEEPEWLSAGSKILIHQMLQQDPSKRISIQNLMTHPWMLATGLGPVTFRPGTKSRSRDDRCVSVLAEYRHVSTEEMWQQLSMWKYNHDTATYLLLMDQKRRGLTPRIVMPARALFRARGELNLHEADSNRPGHSRSPNNATYTAVKAKKASPQVGPLLVNNNKENVQRSQRRPAKRHHSPEPSPAVPAKMSTPNNKDTLRSPATPRDSARKMLGRGLHRIRQALTPRGHQFSPLPAVVKTTNLCNISTTSSRHPEHVVNTLMEALRSKGITVKRKGFTVRGKVDNIASKLKFELEVCLIEQGVNERIVGIKRKRLRGDIWAYRQVCEEVLALASNDFPDHSTLV